MDDPGAAIEEAWDFEDPVGSEVRLRSLLTHADGQQALVLRSQVARALGLQQRYEEAEAELDAVVGAGPGAEARIRERLERGRLLRSAGDPDRAAPLFAEAAALADPLLPGLRIDALHMEALVAGSPGDQVARTESALAEARASDDPAARRWVPSLLNNLGMARHDAGDLRGALAAFEEALAERRERDEPRETQIATWMVGWALRLLGRDDEALRIQTALKAELEAEGATDPYVDEEIATLRHQDC